MSKNKNKSELLTFDEPYILKDIFLYDLKLDEVRVCVLLTSKLNKTVDNMSFQEKLWCVGGTKKNIKYLKNIEHKLIELNLIQDSGLGYSIKDRQFCQPKADEFYNCKSVRQIFIVCLKYWFVNGKYISIKKEYVYNMFGEEKRNRNRNIKNILKSMNIDATFEERKNDFLYEEIENQPTETIEENNSYGSYIPKEQSCPLGLSLEAYVNSLRN